jgi:hypothetical protein
MRSVVRWGAAGILFAVLFASFRRMRSRVSARSDAHVRHAVAPMAAIPWWRQPVVIIPIVISAFAAVTAGAAFWDQHKVYVATALASDRADASLVSFWTGVNTPTTVEIQNLSAVPMSSIWIEFLNASPQSSRLTYINAPVDGILLPCTRVQFDTTSWYPLRSGPFAVALFFTDTNGQTWQLSVDDNSLSEGMDPSNPTLDATYQFASTQAVSGCG